jgi:hypothetical protein
LTNLTQYLQECTDFLGQITIDQAFIDYRNQKKQQFGANGRDDNTRLMHADCLIIEYSMVQSAFASESYCKEFDFEIRKYNSKVDVKIYNKWFNVPAEKTNWYLMNINKGLLTDFAFYKWVNKPLKPLEVGNVVQVELVEVRNAKEVMQNLSISQYGGYYYIPKK